MWWAGAWLAASLQLTWEAPAQCPTKAEIDDRIVQLLSPEILERAPPLTVRARVEALADSEWVLELEIETVAGLRSRTVESPDCTSLADLTALVVALAVDPLAVAAATSERAQPPPAPANAEPQPEPQPTLEPQPTPEPQPEPQPDTTRATGFAAARFGAGYGQVPRPSTTTSITLGLDYGNLRMEFGGHFVSPQTSLTFVDGVELGGTYLLGSASAHVCPTPRVSLASSTLSVPMCLGVNAGAVRGRPIGLSESAPGHAAYAAGSIAPSLSWRVGRLALWLGVDAQLVFVRPAFDAAGLDQALYESPWINVRGQFGVEVHFE